MKRPVVLAIILVLGVAAAFAQKTPNRYEVELIENPNPGKKDTRQINCVLVFEKDSIKVISRRSSEVYREFKYVDIKTIEHSFSKNVFFGTDDTFGAAIASALFGPSLFLMAKKEKHWLAIAAKDGFAVLKIENDNYRLIKMEFTVKDLKVEHINEDKR